MQLTCQNSRFYWEKWIFSEILVCSKYWNLSDKTLYQIEMNQCLLIALQWILGNMNWIFVEVQLSLRGSLGQNSTTHITSNTFLRYYFSCKEDLISLAVISQILWINNKISIPLYLEAGARYQFSVWIESTTIQVNILPTDAILQETVAAKDQNHNLYQ